LKGRRGVVVSIAFFNHHELLHLLGKIETISYRCRIVVWTLLSFRLLEPMGNFYYHTTRQKQATRRLLQLSCLGDTSSHQSEPTTSMAVDE
jgi:hypothetical protein